MSSAKANERAPGKDATRCARADCTALREEIELIKGDLAELETENEQLHDKLARVESERNAETQRLQTELTSASEQLATKEAEISRLNERIKELNVKPLSKPADKQLEQSVSNKNDAETVKLREQNAALEEKLKELRTAIARETSVNANAQQTVTKIQQESKDKRDELYKVLKENEVLRTEKNELEDALKKISEVALDYELTIKVLHDQNREFMTAMDEQTVEITQLHTKLDQVEQEKEMLATKLLEMDDKESDVEQLLKEAKMKSEMEKAVLRAELDELHKTVSTLKQQLQTQSTVKQPSRRGSLGADAGVNRRASTGGVDEDSIEELEAQLTMLQELRVRDRATIQQLNQRIDQLQSDLESMVEHLESGNDDTDAAVKAAIEAEQRKNQGRGAENESLKRRLKEQNILIEELEFRQSQLEKELVEAQEWNAKYEANAGLEDVMKYQKKLRRELEHQQRANQKLRQDLNDQIEATGKLNIAFSRLKAETGRPAEFEYDDLAIEEHLKGELAVNQAVMAQMEHQIQELEAERVRLLQKMREHARLAGGKLYDAHGLTIEQWKQVEEFIQCMKVSPEVAKRWKVTADAHVLEEAQIRDATGASTDSTQALAASQKEVKRLLKEVARLRNELDTAAVRNIATEPNTARCDDGEAKDETKPIDVAALVEEHVGRRIQQEMRRLRQLPTTQHVSTSTPPSPEKKTSNVQEKRAQEEKGQQKETDEKIREKKKPLDDVVNVANSSHQASPSPEALAQAIANALESRLSLFRPSPAQEHPINAPGSPGRGRSNEISPSTAFATEDEMAQEINFLQEFQLVLQEFSLVESQNEVLRTKLFEHEATFKALMDQQSVVYLHVFHLQDEATQANTRFQSELQELRQRNQELRLKNERYEATLHTISRSNGDGSHGDADTTRLRTECVDLTRHVANLEISMASKQREFELLEEAHRMCVSEAQRLENDWLDMERVLKCRILYLESWKIGAEEMLARNEKTLDECVLAKNARRTQAELETLLAKHARLSEEYTELQSRYLKVYDLPHQVSKLEHERAILVAERSARGPNDKNSSIVDAMTSQRVTQLENELKTQKQRVKELEEKLGNALTACTDPQSVSTGAVDRTQALETENALLYERIQEVEQLYASLVRECTSAKDVAALAASQAHQLSRRMLQEKAKRVDYSDQLQELRAASEDHSIVAKLQQQLMHLKTNYQQFLMKYDNAVETQQQMLLKHQHLELQLENHAKTSSERQEKARAELVVLETAIASFKERDYVVRNTKWEAFKKRLDGLEEELRAEQERRRALEKELEDKQIDISFQGHGEKDAAVTKGVEISRLKSRIEALETRERVLMAQLEAHVVGPSGGRSEADVEAEKRSQQELMRLKSLHGDLIKQVQTLQARIAELLQKNNDLEAQKRHAISACEDLQLECQHLHAQLQMHTGHQGNQVSSTPSSPIMRKKVGMYEKDQAELQQAAQATIASLKLLVEEKNALITEYQSKLTRVRADMASTKAQDRVEITQLNKKLYDENQKMIQQLKEAMETIRHLEKTGKDKKALAAAEERHEFVLQEWKRVEMELEQAKQKLREREVEIQVLTNERDIAEARAGEALEEIVLRQDQIQRLEKDKTTITDQLVVVKRDMGSREEKMQLLRDAIIRLKEEFLKAEDRHAIELAKAQHSVKSAKQSEMDREKKRMEEAWQEERERLEAQVQILTEKLALAKKAEDKARKDAVRQAKRPKKPTTEKEQKHGDDDDNQMDSKSGATPQHVLEAEVERLKSLLKEKVVSEARTVENLEKKIKVLHAQNLALRESAVNTSVLPHASQEQASAASTLGEKRREQWESEKRLQRRVEVLSLRLKEKQDESDKRGKECEQLRERVQQLQTRLEGLQRAATSAREAMQGGPSTVPTERTVASASARAADPSELERQNAFLQEALVLKRKEWEEQLSAQMEKYETQLHRLRSRLTRHPNEGGGSSALEREEREYLVTQEIRDELSLLGEELRDKERLLVEKDTKLMDLELENESLRVEYERLHRKTSASTQGTTGRTEGVATSAARRATTAGSRPKPPKSSVQERQVLEEVIENMKKVIEKLRSENEKLRREVTMATSTQAMTPEKADALRKKLRDARDGRQELQAEVERLRQEAGELKKEKLRLQQRVRTLASSATSPSVTNAKNADLERLHQLQLQDKDKVIATLQSQLGELHQTLDKKDVMIRELNEHIMRNTKSRGEEEKSPALQQRVEGN
ncbi:hypothetical protein Poli38472_001441 [Pythium oligandrum]|uniref:Uncharacterized protein n=1 Tax=Pythium oligandrum TaxID=41045 RepID=A0A8K1FME5_PYTOL|nr:hypothetical protein Poli38472_001441 [Pythium oligandrum]|eukprot:TMW69285.1 hypothetical protein Poli38472_001441 [Pythium oligandrum]